VVLEQGLAGQMITIYDNKAHIPMIWTHLIPATMEGRATHNVQNALFAAAICYGLGKGLEDIRHGLRTFNASFFQAPGRMNVFDEHPFRVILDYGHNPAAIEAMTKLIQQLDPDGRRICVVTLPGDRRNEDIAEAARIVAGGFDHFICRRDDNARGRGDDEVPQLMRAALIANGVAEEAIEVIPSESEAVDAALNMAKHGDLVLIFGDQIQRTWKQIIYFNREEPEESAPAETREPEAPAEPVPDDPLAAATPVPDAPDIPQSLLLGGIRMVRDARGVRVETEPEDSD
jgi:cyanophycin synthetase